MLQPPPPDVPSLTAEETAPLVANGAILIDVREPNEWTQARFPGAELRSMSTINDWYVDLPRDRTIVVACRTGNRSAHVVKALIDQAGFQDVHNLSGGIVAWAHAGLPLDDGAAPA